MSGNHDIGIIGMGVMGRNLALNMAGKGFKVAVYDYWQDRVEVFLKEKNNPGISGAATLEGFSSLLNNPRIIMLMLKAGHTVDSVIESLIPLLNDGDIIIDGGNSFYHDTRRRAAELEKKSIYFIGAGISGGEEGALKGPSIMPGGDKAAYMKAEHILTAIAARVDGQPCCGYIGADGSGHYVKMVHNGIEYGDMQLICEAYHILKSLGGFSHEQLHSIFNDWNRGELESYLIEITADIFSKYDEETGLPVVDIILDKAGQKGTGLWASQSALELATPAPTISEAVFARYMSSLKEERVKMASLYDKPDGNEDFKLKIGTLAEDVRKALYASKICSYAQGFALMSSASAHYGWGLNLSEIAGLFRGGCIIRARFLERIIDAYRRDHDLRNLLTDSYFKGIINDYQEAWRRVAALSVLNGIPIPAFSSALSYFDGYRTEKLPANLLQAQRDYFGAHTFERVDRSGSFHYKWF